MTTPEHPKRRATDRPLWRHLWTALADWLKHNPNRVWWGIVGAIVIGAFALLGSNTVRIEHSLNQIQDERAARISVQNSINAYICKTNDDQDNLLSGLIVVALAGSDNRQLTPQEQQGKQVFEDALKTLQSKPNCKGVIEELIDE